MAKLVEIIAIDNLHGEGVQWNAADGCIWWTDLSGCRLHRYHLESTTHAVYAMPEPLGCFAFVAGEQRLLAAFATGFALLELEPVSVQWLAHTEPSGSGRRMNDGRSDRQGRFWAGSMVSDAGRAEQESAHLYRMDVDGSVVAVLGGIGIANGLCWSPDATTMYFADSCTRRIDSFRFDPESGTVAERRVFAASPPGAEPDGATVAADGCVWSAQWDGGMVMRYAPDGRELERVCTPGAARPTSVAFVGSQLDMLCVTSARLGLCEAALRAQPRAGHLFLFADVGHGLPEAHACLRKDVLA